MLISNFSDTGSMIFLTVLRNERMRIRSNGDVSIQKNRTVPQHQQI